MKRLGRNLRIDVGKSRVLVVGRVRMACQQKIEINAEVM